MAIEQVSQDELTIHQRSSINAEMTIYQRSSIIAEMMQKRSGTVIIMS